MPSNNINDNLKTLILLAQCFGYFPILNLSNPQFSIKSIKMFYAVFTIFGPIVLSIKQAMRAAAADKRLNLKDFEKIVKYSSAIYVAIVFIQLARKWPELIRQWRNIDMRMGAASAMQMRSSKVSKQLKKNIISIIGVFMVAFFIEYFLRQTSKIYKTIECLDHNSTENFLFKHNVSYILQQIPYNLIHQIWVVQIDFSFTYTDVFVMVISICLASGFEQITQRIKFTAEKKIIDPTIWKQIHQDYSRQCDLCNVINKNISNIILISFLPNVFTILTQVYNTLKPRMYYIETGYFYFSLVFLISRTATVCICGAMVNGASNGPLNILNSVSHRVYNEEIETFIDRISNFEVCLSGKHFFNIKRNIILEIASAIVTYELVLIQFNQDYMNSWTLTKQCE